GAVRESPARLDQRHMLFLIELHQAQVSLCPLPWSALTPQLSARLEQLNHNGFHYYSHLLETAAARCARTLGNVQVPCGLGHGDFAPWNIRMAGRQLLVIDWEYGSETHPPLWD